MRKHPKDEWIVGEGIHEGDRIIARINIGLQRMIGDIHYPFRAGISITFKNPQYDGMPLAAELDIFADIENIIVDYFTAEQKGMLCAVTSTQGAREFVVYSDSEDISRVLRTVSKKFPEYELRYYIELDKEWNEYQYLIA